MAEKNIIQTETVTRIIVDEDGDVNGLVLLSEVATTDTPGIASFDPEDFAITEDGHVYAKQKVGAIQYIGLPERYSDTSNTENLVWSIDLELSPKKHVEIVRNDLIMASGDVEEFGVTVGDVFRVLSTIEGKVLTDVKREFSVRGPTGSIGPQGNPGTDGSTPDISVNASVDQTVGIATVVVDKGGTLAEPTFDLAFSGIKGEVGERGPKGDTGDSGTNLYVHMEIEDGKLYLLSDSVMSNEFMLEDGCLYLEDA